MTTQPQQFVISIMSRDRVGIVHEVSTAISQLNGDIADLRQTVLRGYFTMILLATFPKSVAPNVVTNTLLALNQHSPTSLEIAVKAVNVDKQATHPAPNPDYTYVLTASGVDRIGFVASVSKFCAENKINILDLSTTVAGEQYIMILLVDLSRCQAIEQIQQKLQAFGAASELTVALQHHDIFTATSEINIHDPI